MSWTNRFNLPKPFELLITADLYNKNRDLALRSYCSRMGLDVTKVKVFSASDLIRPPRVRVLGMRYAERIIKDVADQVYSMLGSAIHYILRQAAVHGELEKEGWKAEERMFAVLTVAGQQVVITGEPDIVSPEGVISDYKVCAVWAWWKGAKTEWEQQTNIYAWLRHTHGLTTTGIKICYILRDWSQTETVQEGYPPAPSQTEDVRLWPIETASEFIKERVALHLAAERQFDEELPECSDYEMWAREDSWAVIRDGGARATKVYSAKIHLDKGVDPEQAKVLAHGEAELDAGERNKSPKIAAGKEKPYVVEHRPGERVRCLRFCDVRAFCSQFQEYAGASFRGTGVSRQPAEETL